MNSTIGFNPMRFTEEELETITVSDINTRLTRTHYFDGRLLTARDLNRDQTYVDERLRELGRAYGSGVIHGLEVELRFGILQVSAGRAVSPSGRVLELSLDNGETLDIDLNSSADISALNEGQYRHIDRGLYALVLRYAEIQQDTAEVFPTDLGSERKTQADTYAEGVDLALVKLPVGLEQDDPVAIRNDLIWSLPNNSSVAASLPAEGVPLGILAMNFDQALWFDKELLRQPLRSEINAEHLNQDLERRHRQLFSDIITLRNNNGYPERFPALEYFHTLPPVGPLPKASVNPALGLQSYFPDTFKVHIAPVNRADIPAIRAESMPLSPLRLRDTALQEVMILAPLDDADYAEYAQRLEVESLSDDDGIDIPVIKPLQLTQQGSIQAANADWQALWDNVNDEELFYVRRPGRAAETGVSAVVLARGAVIPAPTPPTPIPPYDGPILAPEIIPPGSVDIRPGGSMSFPGVPTTPEITPVTEPPEADAPAAPATLAEEQEIVLNHINLDRLAKHRPPRNRFERKAFMTIREKLGREMEAVLTINDLLLRLERNFDDVLWRTLSRLESQDAALELIKLLEQGQASNSSTPELILKARDEGFLNLTDAVTERWKNYTQGR
ncbi:MAG TPA: hypothetical protein ENK35_03945 [Candidatus Tenderia sp.]|nr:hypothetical protein [Candidatus Tenderia sp.]